MSVLITPYCFLALCKCICSIDLKNSIASVNACSSRPVAVAMDDHASHHVPHVDASANTHTVIDFPNASICHSFCLAEKSIAHDVQHSHHHHPNHPSNPSHPSHSDLDAVTYLDSTAPSDSPPSYGSIAHKADWRGQDQRRSESGPWIPLFLVSSLFTCVFLLIGVSTQLSCRRGQRPGVDC